MCSDTGVGPMMLEYNEPGVHSAACGAAIESGAEEDGQVLVHMLFYSRAVRMNAAAAPRDLAKQHQPLTRHN